MITAKSKKNFNTDGTNRKSLDDLVQYVTLHVRNPILLSGLVLPFIPFYFTAFFLWIFVYGRENHYEAGLLSIVGIAFVHTLTMLCCYWSVHVLAFLNCRRVKLPEVGVLAKVIPTANNGASEMVAIKCTELEDEDNRYYFYFQKTKYVWDNNKCTFRAVEFPVNDILANYVKSRGLETVKAAERAELVYGNNSMEMVVPEFYQLFIERATAPFFVFQIFSVLLWCLDDYWYYSLFTLCMLVVFECTLVQQQLRNMGEIRKMGNKPYLINVLRQNKWRLISSAELLPGDLVSIIRSQNDNLVPCDLVLIRGNCIVDESMLTGESVPQTKEPLEKLSYLNKELEIEGEEKLHVLFGGTRVIQHTAPTKDDIRSPDNGSIGYVLRNGFNTSQGKLLRTILFGVKRVTENNLETFGFVFFLMIFAIMAASYVWIKGTEDPERNRYKLFLECTIILTSIIPPDLPIELTLAVNTSLMQLSKLYIFCTEPFRIPFAGKVQICCFDKTGTLTSDNLMVDGITGTDVNDDKILPVQEAMDHTKQVLASCHSLVLVDNELVGDPLEKAILTAVDWSLTRLDSVLPKRGNLKPIKIVQRFHFSSKLKRMSVLAGYLTQFSTNINYIGTVKGAPEVIMNMLETVPDNYERTYLKYARRGSRVLALGIKTFKNLSAQEVRDMKREQVECNLTFAGFVIISCPVKPDSKAVIKELIQSSHKVTMITGDNPLTACHVARELRFTRKKLLVLTAPPKSNNNTNNNLWHWVTVDESIKYDNMNIMNGNEFKQILIDYDLCITGEGLEYLKEFSNCLTKLLPYITVFARFSPKQKEFVITTLKQSGYYTLMCGDGTNDVGALKHANVGVSILTGQPIRVPKKTANALVSPVINDRTATTRGRQLAQRQTQSQQQQTGTDNVATSQARLQTALKEMEDDQVQIVKLGDASIAAPFTSRGSSIVCVNQIIKQGRCTLVTTLQMFKILALNALISAYCQSVLYIDGVKFSDTQATLQGLFIAACFLFITRSKPLKTLSKVAPLPNIFNLYTITTILGQFVVHFAALYYLTHEATIRSPPREGKIKLMLDMKPDEKEEFVPNIINSTVYICCLALQVSTFAVNYKGHPFMESLRENKLLLNTTLIISVLVAALSSGFSQSLSEFFEIITFPDDFRLILIFVLVADVVSVFLVDRVSSFLFGEERIHSKAFSLD